MREFVAGFPFKSRRIIEIHPISRKVVLVYGCHEWHSYEW